MGVIPKTTKEDKNSKITVKHPTLKQATHNDIKTTIYVKSSTPFVSGIKRINKFLNDLDKRKKDPKFQCVVLLGMGKATEKTMALGCYFAEEKGKRLEVRTKSVDVIDEVIAEGNNDDSIIDDRDRDTSLKKRSLSGIEIKIYP
ncbi:similar to Saccharomyces cerevisiae YBR167C POP7 Subunit of both RNase MRP and nuclear RNase P [Maudiozyma barnettii]|uniref:Similar to Saccharomyces cerevisiae YBR167C POP7 Subunit of both RNase MRP and nuclear RNase P n=1 Tax=Maudiozyma barnettii TaxID=61262 RepID=A0A8H2ZIW6_9SACH|nr:ribonuclease P/MRP protein subunit POP7 [Kazachstania barnettii]CAB4253657.1 similar to Saccharomyces cerevisiae YBR167C POP7 Subunit of both RNase MRP and nuclear RNase P [Kazachstania barnettii]CAD1781348.1 similar to Saccharomyces cerevisiae YBR167C POP7 Subunit of both RNase MRP and nuclear RNase P [Kazachstania barnettii]